MCWAQYLHRMEWYMCWMRFCFRLQSNVVRVLNPAKAPYGAFVFI